MSSPQPAVPLGNICLLQQRGCPWIAVLVSALLLSLWSPPQVTGGSLLLVHAFPFLCFSLVPTLLSPTLLTTVSTFYLSLPIFPCGAPPPAVAQPCPVVGGWIRLEPAGTSSVWLDPAVSGWNQLYPAGTGCVRLGQPRPPLAEPLQFPLP